MKNTNILLLVLFNCLISVLNGQSLEENFIKTTEYLDEFDLSQKKTTLQYFDGLGRPIQIINHKQSPFGKDIIQHIEYDEFGRQVKEFLPFTKNRTSINIESDAAEKTMTYYNTKYGSQIAYSEKEIEASSLNRVLKQAAPGDDWALGSGNEIKFDYETNENNEVLIFNVQTVWNPPQSIYSPSLIKGYSSYSFYPAGQLYKTITMDENHTNGKNHSIEEFKNKQGQVILKRTYDNNQTHDTYYVYDIYGNLTYVLPPKVNHNGSVTSQIINELCYQYKYDDRNRLVEKKLPGKEWEYMIYDKQNRLVATQDGNMRSTNATINPFNLTQKVWLFTKYDKFGRVAYTGLYKNNGSRTQIQNLVNGMGSNNENRGNNFSLNGITVNYSKDGGFPQNNAESEILSVNYYDDYNFPGAIATPSSVFGEQVISVTPNSSTHYVTTKNLPTASFVRVLGGNLWEKTFTYYDAKSRPIQTYKINHLQGRTIVNNEFDFRGKVLKTKTTHNRTNADPILTTQSEFSYDHAERLIKQTFQVNNESVQSLAVHEYDSLGQLKTKKVGGSNTFSNPLQIIDYKYNIRGWMTDINDIDNLNPTSQPQDLFAFKINYNQLTAGANQPAGVEKLYNGNISQTFWRTANDNKLRGYAYSYDALNRLDTAYYRKGTTYSNNFNESLSYDKNGNILSLQRWGVPEDHGTVPAIPNMDDLTYTYFPNSNKLRKVSDGVASTKGFNDGVNLSTEYIYDPNANMKEDKNKGITEIKYNHLNLPTEIKFSNHQKIAYIYNALGTKIEKTVTNGSNISKTEYLDSFQYIDGELQFFPVSEGYVRKTEGNRRQQYFDYVYNYTDHLGNIRLSYTTDPQSPSNIKILEESNYYPFGLQHGSYNTPARDYRPIGDAREIETVDRNPYKYKYNAKEYQDELGLDWYDYGARNYDASLGRWMNVDPLAEQTMDPYGYVWNNPIKYIDPDGLSGQTTIVKEGEKAGTYVVVDWVDDGKTDVVLQDGTKVGESLTTHSFVSDNGEAVQGAIIDLNDDSGQKFFDNQLSRGDIDLWDYMPNATGGQDYDFKRDGTKKGDANYDNPRYHYRGMKFEGKIASARDVGNYSAGAVAGFNGKAWKGQTRLAFDLLEKWQNLNPFSVEGKPTQKAERAGHNLTYPTYLQNEKWKNGPAIQKYQTIKSDPFYGNRQKW